MAMKEFGSLAMCMSFVYTPTKYFEHASIIFVLVLGGCTYSPNSNLS
jgi:hypothetical protein